VYEELIPGWEQGR